MLLLTQGTGHKIQLVTDATGDIEASVSYVDKVAGTGGFQYNFTGAGDPLASITTATTTDIVAGAASTERSVRYLNFYNAHASTAVTCTVQEVDGTHTAFHKKVVLAAGESLSMDAAGVWTHYDANGGPYVGVGPIATQAEMEGGSSITTVVTPGRQHYHPSAAKAWGKFGVAANVLASYNITSLTDTGTGVIAVTIATDFSTSDYACNVTVEATATTWAVANTRECHIRSATLAAGTVSFDCTDNTATTSLVKDPTSWHCAMFGDHA